MNYPASKVFGDWLVGRHSIGDKKEGIRGLFIEKKLTYRNFVISISPDRSASNS